MLAEGTRNCARARLCDRGAVGPDVRSRSTSRICAAPPPDVGERAVQVTGRAKADDLLEAALHTTWRRTLRFFDNMHVDLHHFAGNLADDASDARAIKQACVDVQRAVEGKGARSPIIAEGHVGSRMQPARGLSIYFPSFRGSVGVLPRPGLCSARALGGILGGISGRE